MARLGAVDTISVRPLPVLGLLGRLSALRIHWRIRYLSLGYDAGKLVNWVLAAGPSPSPA